MKHGEWVTIKSNYSNHNIPIGERVQIINVTDDDFKVWWNGKFHWIVDEDCQTTKEKAA